MKKKLFFALPLVIASALTAHTVNVAAATKVIAPLMKQGIQLGDLTQDSVMVWSRSNKDARMMIEYALNDQFTDSTIIRGPYALRLTDYTARQELTKLPSGKDIYVRVWFEDLTNARNKSKPVTGHFHTLSADESVRFVWGGDTAGQGWGINKSFGGMKIYEAMRQTKPHFFIHSGDNIYADGIINPEQTAENGQIWTNVVTPEVAKVAETQNEFRGRYKYNLSDDNVRAFNAEVPQIWQWDDHEVVNNWSDSKDLSADTRYVVKDIPLLVARASTAFKEYSAQRPHGADEPDRVYSKISYGPLLDVFVIDMRSYRSSNTANLQTVESAETAFLGNEQISWLVNELSHSTATWKVIAADMPIGLNIGDGTVNNVVGGTPRWEAIANGNDDVAAGRELEIARLLSDVKKANVNNIIWLTADVHYAAAHYYDASKAKTSDFNNFYEFVAGPLNAGSFGPNTKDATFGPQVLFEKAPAPGQVNLSPYAGLQFFGEVNIDKASKAMTVDFKDINGDSVFSKTLDAQ